MEYQVLSCIFHLSQAMATLGLKEMGKFLWEGSLQTPSLYRLQGTPCVVILPCKDPVKITGYHSNPLSYVVGT